MVRDLLDGQDELAVVPRAEELLAEEAALARELSSVSPLRRKQEMIRRESRTNGLRGFFSDPCNHPTKTFATSRQSRLLFPRARRNPRTVSFSRLVNCPLKVAKNHLVTLSWRSSGVVPSAIAAKRSFGSPQ